MTTLSSSSFFLSNYLTKQLKGNNFRTGQFSYALKYHHITALTLAEAKADPGSAEWLTLNQVLANSQQSTALKLGYWYQQQALQESNILMFNTAIMWFEQSIRLNSQQGILALAQLYFEQAKLIKSQVTLQLLNLTTSDERLVAPALILRINLAVSLGNVTQLEKLINPHLFTLHKSELVQNLLVDLERYSVIKNSKSSSNINDNSVTQIDVGSTCIANVQLFATSLSHLKHIEQLIKTFKEQQGLAKYVCLPTPRYISVKQLDCVTQSHKAITCNEISWRKVAKEVDSRHIGLMVKEGGANVHLGILYFDVDDDVNVLSHEISHLLGFVDEYPLRKGHAKCQGIQSKPFAHNIAVLNKYYQGDRVKVRSKILMQIPWAHTINDDTPILQRIDGVLPKNKYWKLGTPLAYKGRVGVHVSESCLKVEQPNNVSVSENDYSAFKPLSRHTQLRYFTKVFPKEYLNFLKVGSLIYAMPSFHYNIALALYQQGKVSDAKYWLIQAAKWESNPIRKKIILKGAF